MFTKKRMLFITALTLLVCVGQASVGLNANATSSPDFDGDGMVGISDFLLFVNKFGSSRGDGTYEAKYDLDGDGVIGTPDFLLFVDNFGKEVSSPTVDILDANLLAKIEAALNKASGAPITVADMRTLTRLEANDSGISDLTGLEFATNLTTLDLQSNSISDISALSRLTKLTFLKLGYNNRTLFDYDLIPMPENSGITDISPLSGLTNLTVLELQYNSITDISALSGLTNLGHLILQVNPISDISALSDLTNLSNLIFGANSISDISALSELTRLRWLVLEANNIADLSALSGLTNLESLDLNRNDISDISALSGLTNLEDLNLWHNKISDISALSGLTNLRRLNLSHNSIMDISALSKLIKLTELGLAHNSITDISPLRDLTNLTVLGLQWNSLLNDASFNDHIPALESRGVTVFFTRFHKGDFDIELVFLGSFTEDQKNVLRLVARRWMSVITGDLPDYEFTQGWSGRCGEQSYEIPAGERIDDLRIYMTTLKGAQAVGVGGPSLLREETYLPVLGCMRFDLERANLLITGLHEIGHVLGFGTVWGNLNFLQDLDADTHFNGPLAIDAFNDVGGQDYVGKKVPVEKMDGSHWRGNVFDWGELMLPWGGGALSAITVQSLADLGYDVDVTQADPYTLPDATSVRASAQIAAAKSSISDADVTPTGVASALPLIFNDRLRGRLERAEPKLTCGVDLMREPIHVVDPQGRIVRTISR